MCGCGLFPQNEKVVVRKRKRTAAAPKKTEVVMTQIQVQEKQRGRNRAVATKLAEKGRIQMLKKYPLQQSVLKAPKAKGRHFPPKQETQRLINRQKVSKQVGDLLKEITKKHKEATTKWHKTQSGWQKKK